MRELEYFPPRELPCAFVTWQESCTELNSLIFVKRPAPHLSLGNKSGLESAEVRGLPHLVTGQIPDSVDFVVDLFLGKKPQLLVLHQGPSQLEVAVQL